MHHPRLNSGWIEAMSATKFVSEFQVRYQQALVPYLSEWRCLRVERRCKTEAKIWQIGWVCAVLSADDVLISVNVFCQPGKFPAP